MSGEDTCPICFGGLSGDQKCHNPKCRASEEFWKIGSKIDDFESKLSAFSKRRAKKERYIEELVSASLNIIELYKDTPLSNVPRCHREYLQKAVLICQASFGHKEFQDHLRFLK